MRAVAFNFKCLEKLIADTIKNHYNDVIVISDSLSIYVVKDSMVIDIGIHNLAPLSLTHRVKFKNLSHKIFLNESSLKNVLDKVFNIMEPGKVYDIDIEYYVRESRRWYVSNFSVTDTFINLGLMNYFINGDVLMFSLSDSSISVDKFKKDIEVSFFPNGSLKHININPINKNNFNNIAKAIRTFGNSEQLKMFSDLNCDNHGFFEVWFNINGEIELTNLLVGGKVLHCKRNCQQRLNDFLSNGKFYKDNHCLDY